MKISAIALSMLHLQGNFFETILSIELPGVANHLVPVAEAASPVTAINEGFREDRVLKQDKKAKKKAEKSKKAKKGNAPTTVEAVPPEWPSLIMKIGGGLEGSFPNMLPTTTDKALASGWKKAEGESCDPLLGETWLIGGKRSAKTSNTLYFTASSAGAPGVISAIGVDYYGYIDQNKVGVYYGEEKTSPDGTYHTAALALRDYKKEELCDANTPLSTTKLEKITLAPGMAEENVPINQNDDELQTGWKEGSCHKNMGTHWFKDTIAGSDLTYEASNLVPIVPMYSGTDGEINGVFFVATGRKQTWPDECAIDRENIDQPCAAPYLNAWDRRPGQTEANKPPAYFCDNFCDKNCGFSGSPDGYYDTMHWFFTNTFAEREACGESPRHVFCRNGEYPQMEE